MGAGDESDGGGMIGGAVLMRFTTTCSCDNRRVVHFFVCHVGHCQCGLLKAKVNALATRKSKNAHSPVTPGVMREMG